jgi:hypothetical protein
MQVIIVAIVLRLQGAWLLPALNARADAFARGDTSPAHSQHRWYIFGEAAKLILRGRCWQ